MSVLKRTCAWAAALILTNSVGFAAPFNDPSGGSSSDAPLVTLEFADTDVRDALRLVARQCGVNIVASNDVTGSVSLSLDNATLEETLDAITSVAGLEYSSAGSIITVQTLAELIEQRNQREAYEFVEPEVVEVELMPLVLNLRFVDAERVLSIVESMLSERGSVSLLKTTDHVAQERGVSSAPAASASDLQIGTQLPTSSQGQPASSHTLVVFDEPARLERIEGVVQSVDVKPQQVVIEARFVEISLGQDERLGIDWNAVARMNGSAAPHTAPFGNSTLGEFDPNDASGSPSVFPPAPVTVTSGAEPGLFTFGTLDFTAFSALLELIQRDTDVQLVSNPRVVVGDRHTATILVGERYPILSANISEFGSVTEQLDHYEPIGVQLAVTPSVLEDEVELLVRPSTSSLGSEVEGSTGLVVARINSRQIDTLVRVKNGQTVVVGGLITSREFETESRVPFLGSVPLLGHLFRHRSTQTERVDLVVFLTVSIVQDNGLTEAQRRLFEQTSVAGDLVLQPDVLRSALDYEPVEPLY